MDISANTATGRDIDQNLTAREFLNAAYPNADQQVALINGARVNATLLGISLGESDDDVLNLPAAVVFPDLMLGPIARPTSLDLDTSHSLDHHAEILPNIPDEEPISPSDPRYMFLQNNFPEVEPEHYSRHIELLASLAGIEAENFDLLQLPMNAFVPTPAPQPDYQPLSLEEAQERFSDISPEAYADQNNAFIRNLIENSPKRWDFVNRLRNNITSITPSLSLRREWFTILDVIVKKSDPDLEGKETQDLARAYLFKIYSILKNSDVSQERKLELLKYVASYKNSPAHLWLEAMQQELALQKEIDPKTMAFHTEEGACAAGVSGISSRRILLPTLKSKPSTKEFNDYIKLLKNLLSRPVCTEMDNIHLAPTNDEYLESLTRNSPKTWKPIREPLEKRIKELTPNSSIHNAWSRILLVLSTARDRLMSSQEAQALSQSTMYQLLQLLNNPKIPQDKKLSILSNIASYSNRCAPTWVRTTGQELQAIFNANDVSTNIVFSWVQIFKEHLLAQICRDEREWHIMTAFKHQYGAELGLDNTGVFLDTYTRTLASDRYRTKHENYLQEFLNAYETSGEGLVNSALSQALGGSQDQILALRDIILADLTAIGIPEEYRADIMTEVFFPEDNNYNPSREAILYLLLKEGVITAQDRSSTP
ncbi:hypothetical protein [Chlamydia felis Fe/C-56]|uniref:Uncharacterized protein n=1 Tax=Chlamydia felis (strain Fe/C-56) TaxID=264202 RepID=Q255Q4_CHLFF|nr:hypothetical protein [Chlamydia felis Fe/C-56]